MVQPTLQELSLKEAHELFSSNSRGPIHEDRRLQVEELDEWRTHKPKTHDKPKLRQNELNTFPNQLKVGDRVLLDTADPHIVTTKPNEDVPLTVLSIFPFSTVEVSHPKFGTFKGKSYLFQTRDAISGHGRATWPWSNLPNTHECATRPCLPPVDNIVKITWACAELHDRGRSEPHHTRSCNMII
ncbi:hypothetical protein GOBAR_AA22835 [Gossypium barbadense]|uniref:Uncharacterized protein n=1 Tax=Gossypium barbadense TaxID=3634 RepID=A0A2P5X3B9_GOSBA|nr:hypothetical protein GOBAR_AA22835 [Gossypium barbadense]